MPGYTEAAIMVTVFSGKVDTSNTKIIIQTAVDNSAFPLSREFAGEIATRIHEEPP